MLMPVLISGAKTTLDTHLLLHYNDLPSGMKADSRRIIATVL